MRLASTPVISQVRCSGISRNAFTDFMRQTRLYSVQLNPNLSLYGDNSTSLAGTYDQINANAIAKKIDLSSISSLTPAGTGVILRVVPGKQTVKVFQFGAQTDYLFLDNVKRDPTAPFTLKRGEEPFLSPEKFQALKWKILFPKGFSPDWLLTGEAMAFFGMMTETELSPSVMPKKPTLDQIDQGPISQLLLPVRDRGPFRKENF